MLLSLAMRVLTDVSRVELDSVVNDVFAVAAQDRIDKMTGREEGVIGLLQFRRGTTVSLSFYTRYPPPLFLPLPPDSVLFSATHRQSVHALRPWDAQRRFIDCQSIRALRL